MTERDKTTREFFDQISDRYSDSIERCVPRYREALAALLDYLPLTAEPTRLLELGCGGGNLTIELARRFPRASLLGVDSSAKQLEVCRQRLRSSQGAHWLQQDFRDLHFPQASFDLVISSISLHHLPHEQQAALIQRIHDWLAPGGVLAYLDQLAGATPDLYRRHMAEWERTARHSGVSAEQWREWMQHQQASDHHAPLTSHFDWLQSAGFRVVDCPWRFLLWTVIIARRD